MYKFDINANKKLNDTIVRTIRVSGKTFDKINSIAQKYKTSFNLVTNQLIEYALNEVDDEGTKKD